MITYDLNISGNPRYDAATANWGTPWRMPQLHEWNELINLCKLEPVSIGGNIMTKIIGPNNNYIILPHAGHIWFTKLERKTIGEYWISNPGSNNENACAIYIYDSGGTQIVDWVNKTICGALIRPVAN